MTSFTLGFRARSAAGLAVAFLTAAPIAMAAEIQGDVRLVSARSGRPARGVDLTEVVVAFVPDAPFEADPPGDGYQMATAKKSFVPSSLVVPAGATVVFPNHDPILHNVFSLTPENPFDLGLFRRGESRSVLFEAPGLVRVFCNVHHDMVGHIFVVDGPFFRQAAEDGSFQLTGLPAGPGRLMVWHPRGELKSLAIEAPVRGLSFRLETNRRRIPSHLNKFGKPYRSRRDRYNR